VTQVRFTPLAESDLAEIVELIARRAGADRADRILSALLDAADRLGTNPRIGHVRRDLTDEDVLFWPVQSFLLVYRARPRWVEIVRVVSGWRDIAALLARDEE
jgi:plasmid stabilization system protein ParE